jgi:hypothetical protein
MEARFEEVEEIGKRGSVAGDGDFGKRDDKVRRQRSAGVFEKGRKKKIERAEGALAMLFRERLDADADKWGKEGIAHGLGEGSGGGLGVGVLVRARTVAVAVFEIDTVILDGFRLELGPDSLKNLFAGERERAVFIEGAQCDFSQLAANSGYEEMGASVERVNGLAGAKFAGIGSVEVGISGSELSFQGRGHSGSEGHEPRIVELPLAAYVQCS